MKKSNIALLKDSAVEVLSKSQMKNVMGGAAADCEGRLCYTHADCCTGVVCVRPIGGEYGICVDFGG